MTLANIILYVAAIALLIPVGVLFVECLAALLPARRTKQEIADPSPMVAVLVPAHNEEQMIAESVKALLPLLKQEDRLVVVADNCTDKTALIAQEAGAKVTERHDPLRRGKGYALAHGVSFLRSDPPDVVVVMDADCFVTRGSLDDLARVAMASGRPVQSVNLQEAPPNATSRDAISALAFLVRNRARPMGLRRLGFPCLLTGTGVAFPWHVIADAPLESVSIVEDMQLSVDLAVLGAPAMFFPETTVTSAPPALPDAARRQRTRWEHGHLHVLVSQVPRLLAAGARQRRLDLFVLALDICVPPLALLTTVLMSALTMSTAAGLWGASWYPAVILASGAFLLISSIIAAWARFGLGTVRLRSLLAIPFYILWKAPIYVSFLLGRQRAWVRTERDAQG